MPYKTTKSYRWTSLLLVGMTIVNVALIALVYGLYQVRSSPAELHLWDQMLKVLTGHQSYQLVIGLGMLLTIAEIGIILLIRKAMGKDKEKSEKTDPWE